MNIKKCLKLLGPKTEWNPAPTEKQVTRQSRGSVLVLVLALTEVVFLTMSVMLPFSNHAVVDLLTLGMWAVTIWASYCAVVEVSSMKIARASANLAEHLRKYEEPLSPLQDLEA